MTRNNKTFKDQKDRKDRAKAQHDSREGKKQEKGGHINLLREALNEELEEESEELGE